jgi:branched-chain amino acid transport system permease protein
MSPYASALIAGLGVGGVYALVAMGYNLVFRATGVFNLAQGQLLSFGALIGFTLWVTHGAPLPVALLVATAGVALIGFVQERITVAPLSATGTTAMAWVITTLGASVVLENVAQLAWGGDQHPVPPLINIAAWHPGGTTVQPANVIILGTALVVAGAVELVTRYTRAGKTWSATAEDPAAARVRGINTRRVGAVSFTVAAAISGFAGVVVAPVTGASFDVGSSLTLAGFAAIAVGGFGSSTGALVGGLIIGVIESESVLVLSAAWHDIVTLLALLIILAIRPNGLFGIYRERVV